MSNRPLETIIRHLRRVLDPDASGAPTDAQLLERYLLSCDESAFELLVWRHGSMVLDLCRRILPQQADVEDAFQATFLALVRKAHTIGKRGSVGSWLYKVAYRVALEAKAHSIQRSRSERQVRARRQPPPEDEASRREIRPILEEEISRLPERYRAPFVLCCLEGRSLEEAARQLGRPRATIGTWVARARLRLRDRLASRGVFLSAAALAALTVSDAASAKPPAMLVEAVLRAALSFARPDGVAAGAVSASVLSLVDAVTQSGRSRRFWLLAGLLLLGSGAGVLGASRREAELSEMPPSFPLAPSPERVLPGTPRGWVAWSDQPAHFAVARDTGIVHGGQASGYVQLEDTAGKARAVLRQAVAAGTSRGLRVRLSGWLKTEGAGQSGLFLREDGVDLMLGLANMEDRAVSGASDWQPYAVVLDISAEAVEITFGVWREGSGRTWVDDVTLETVASDLPATGRLAIPSPFPRLPGKMPVVAVNMDFEDLRPALPVPSPAPPWLGLRSRETGSGPVLVVTYTDGSVEQVAADADAALLAYQPDRECGDLRTLAVSLADTNRTLLHFPAPAAASVARAELMVCCDASPYRPREPFTLAVHKLSETWGEEDVTWRTQPDFAGTPTRTTTVRPDSGEVRVDITPLVQAEEGRDAPSVNLLLKVLNPHTDANAPHLLSEADPRLDCVLPWEVTVLQAQRMARANGKLVLALVRSGRWDENAALGEQMFLGTALYDPDVLALVASRFVPARIRIRDASSAAGKKALRELGLKPEQTRGVALVVGSPDGVALARLPDVQNVQRDQILSFLLDVLSARPSKTDVDPWSLLAAGCLEKARLGFAVKEPDEKGYGLTRIAALQGDYEQVLRLANPVAASDSPFRLRARYQSAVARMRLGRYEQAVRDFRAVAAEPSAPCAPDAAYYLGCLLYRAEQIADANTVWRRLAADHPQSAAAARSRLRLLRPGLMARHECLTAPVSPARNCAAPAGEGKPPC